MKRVLRTGSAGQMHARGALDAGERGHQGEDGADGLPNGSRQGACRGVRRGQG